MTRINETWDIPKRKVIVDLAAELVGNIDSHEELDKLLAHLEGVSAKLRLKKLEAGYYWARQFRASPKRVIYLFKNTAGDMVFNSIGEDTLGKVEGIYKLGPKVEEWDEDAYTEETLASKAEEAPHNISPSKELPGRMGNTGIFKEE
jgi:hypothetical protein